METDAKRQNCFTSVWVEVKATKGIVTKQMSKCEVTGKGLSIPFTKKQMNEVYYI